MQSGFRIWNRGFDKEPLMGADAAPVTYKLYDWPEENIKRYGGAIKVEPEVEPVDPHAGHDHKEEDGGMMTVIIIVVVVAVVLIIAVVIIFMVVRASRNKKTPIELKEGG